MNHFRHGGGIVYVVALILAIALPHLASAQPAAPAWETSLEWKGAALGKPPVDGKHTWNEKDGVLTLTGSGRGVNAREVIQDDQFQFAYIDRKAGDFEIIVRLREFDGDGDAVAGIMVRSADGMSDAFGPMVSLFYRPRGNYIGRISRLIPPQPASSPIYVNMNPRVSARGIGLANKGPLWMRLVRMGDRYAVYKSRDGQLWVQVSNASGDLFDATGSLRVGVFVASGADDGKKVTAVFDSIKIGDPHMRYTSSWVGNTFGARQEGKDSHVSDVLAAMWVAPDGTCYTSAYWDEAHQPVTSYRDGKVLRGLPIGTTQASEGGITGDGRFLYVAFTTHVQQLDLQNIDAGPKPITLSVSMFDRKTNHSAISGMASDGKTLFVADGRDHLIRVVTLEPKLAYAAPVILNGFQAVLARQPVTIPADENGRVDKKFAPEAVYQSQRTGEGFLYTFPNLTPGATYTVRCHLAEYVKRPADNPHRFVTIGGEGGAKIDVAKEAGGEFKALVKDLVFKADDKGNLVLDCRTYGPGICGLEVIDGDGKRIVAVNCGGPAVEGFTGECPELLDRNFAFANPGVMVCDKRGDLWIIQRKVEPPEGEVDGRFATKGAVKCYTADGKFTGRELPDVVNPRTLGYDPIKDELLVGEDLPDLNVRFYGGLADKPKLVRTFGEKGGIYAGKTPGLIYDPEAGGYARFIGITGLGVDAAGNLYVGGGGEGITDLRMFKPDGTFGWQLYSLMFCNTFDVDPASDGEDIYGTYTRIRLDLDKTVAGTEQTYFSYNWDHRRFGAPVRKSGSQPILRRMGPGPDKKKLIMFASGQGHVFDVNIFRYEGELAVPCGSLRKDNTLWIDANGDGLETPDEVVKMEGIGINGFSALVVDSKDNLLIGVPGMRGAFIRKFVCKGFTDAGVPIYGGDKEAGDYEDIAFPEEGGVTSGWSMRVRMDYDADRDILVAHYPRVPRDGENDPTVPQYTLACYENWSKGNREPTWKIKGLSPWEEPDYFMYETDLFRASYYMGMQLAGDYVFFTFLFGEIHVFDLATGKLVEILSMGPEVCGSCAWEDAAMGLRVFQRKNGEYMIFTENGGWGGKNNFLRWKPEK